MCWKWPPTLGRACFRLSRSLKKGKARKGTVRGRHETDCTLTANERAATSTMGMEWTRCKMFVFAGLFDLECDWMEPRPPYEFTMLQPHYSHAPLSMRSCTLVLYACRRRPAGVSDSRQIMIAKTTRGFFTGFSDEEVAYMVGDEAGRDLATLTYVWDYLMRRAFDLLMVYEDVGTGRGRGRGSKS